jgi:hypothetical protein
VTALCRDCGVLAPSPIQRDRHDACGSPRQVRHATLHTLSIAHVDCDAFYATVEKCGRPADPVRPRTRPASENRTCSESIPTSLGMDGSVWLGRGLSVPDTTPLRRSKRS